MSKDYFEGTHEEGKSILVNLLRAIFKGLIHIGSLRVEKNLMGGYRLTMFFNRKDE